VYREHPQGDKDKTILIGEIFTMEYLLVRTSFFIVFKFPGFHGYTLYRMASLAVEDVKLLPASFFLTVYVAHAGGLDRSKSYSLTINTEIGTGRTENRVMSQSKRRYLDLY
jgi:hypothetical protein